MTSAPQPHGSLDPAIVGRSYPAGEVYDVAREVIRAFAHATSIGAPPHPVHLDVEAARALGHPDLLAPPTFAIVVAQRNDARLLADPEVGIEISNVIHAEQTFVHHRPIVAGDSLVASLHVDAARKAGTSVMLTTRSEITSEGGEPVCTATSMIIVRGQP